MTEGFRSLSVGRLITGLAFGGKDEMRVEMARKSMDAPSISVTSGYGGHTASVLP